MGIVKKKISELPLAKTPAGLFTIGVDARNTSVKVPLETIQLVSDAIKQVKTDMVQVSPYNHKWNLIWNFKDEFMGLNLDGRYNELNADGTWKKYAEADFAFVDTSIGEKRGCEFGKKGKCFDIPVPIGDFRGRMKNYTISLEMYVYDDAYINSRVDFPSTTAQPTMTLLDTFQSQGVTGVGYHGYGFGKYNGNWGLRVEQFDFKRILIADKDLPKNKFLYVTFEMVYKESDSEFTVTIHNGSVETSPIIAQKTFSLNPDWSAGDKIGRFLLGTGYGGEDQQTFRGRLRNLIIQVN